MTTRDIVENLKNAMEAATIASNVATYVAVLQELRDLVGNDQAFTLALVVTAAQEIAVNEGIEDADRDLHIGKLIEMLQEVYERTLDEKKGGDR